MTYLEGRPDFKYLDFPLLAWPQAVLQVSREGIILDVISL